MWTVFFLVYAAGVAVTAFCVFRNRVFNQSYLMNAGAVVLWPVYWTLFATSLFLGRSRGEPGPPLK
jgi:hypothetical protein